MSAQGAFKITEEFERLLCEYTGAPYAVAVDNCSNALFLALVRAGVEGREVWIPRHTYPSVPCAIIHAGGRVMFWQEGEENVPPELTGPYPLVTPGGRVVVDSALRFTAGQYVRGVTQCLSFTGPYKHLKLGKGGAILTDSAEDAAWFKRARFSGRNECSYLADTFDMLGWNFYMLPEIAARGVQLMAGFLRDGNPIKTKDLTFRFPDLSRFPIYRQGSEALRGFGGQRVTGGGYEIHHLGVSRDHVGAQSATVTREDANTVVEPAGHARLPIRAIVPPPAEPCPDYDNYRGTP